MEACIMFLCSADPIPFLPFFHLSLPSFLSLLLHLLDSPGWFFALSRKDILSIDFRISLPHSATDSFSSWDCSFQSAPISYRTLDLDMSQPSSQLWAGFDLHMGLHCLHFFFNLASFLVFLGSLSPRELFFLFVTSKIPSFFSLQGLVVFSHFKM